jgi:hypothetical protein
VKTFVAFLRRMFWNRACLEIVFPQEWLVYNTMTLSDVRLRHVLKHVQTPEML